MAKDENPELSDLLESVRASHRFLMMFCVVIFGTYSSSPPSVDSLLELEELLGHVPAISTIDPMIRAHDDDPPREVAGPMIDDHLLERPAPPAKPLTATELQELFAPPDPLPPDLYRDAAIKRLIANQQTAMLFATPPPDPARHLLLCHEDAEGNIRSAGEALSIYARQSDRWSLDQTLSEYEDGTFYAQPWRAFDEFAAESTCYQLDIDKEAPGLSALSCIGSHACHADEVELRIEPQPLCLSLPGPTQNPMCEHDEQAIDDRKAELTTTARVPWSALQRHAVFGMMPVADVTDLELLPSKIRSSAHYPEIANMRLESAQEHIRAMRREIVSSWANGNKTVMAIPLPNRSVLSLILLGIQIYLITFLWVAIGSLRRKPAKIEISWIGLTGRGFPTALTAFATLALPIVAMVAATHHETLALELAGLYSAAPHEPPPILELLYGISSTQSLAAVMLASTVAAVSIFRLKNASTREPPPPDASSS